jgi:quinohemoprotein amine dehydrogenase
MIVYKYAPSSHSLGWSGIIAVMLLLPAISRAAVALDSEALLQTYCSGCHPVSAPNHYARISSMRKSPEGWLMTLVRMQQVHGLRLTTDERDAIVRYLADTQGLAPAEAAPARFALERRPNEQDLSLPDDLQIMCARCHSAARVALQRREAPEWLKLVHFHVGEFPTLEFQDHSRDRMWWDDASTRVPDKLGKLFPLHSQSWDDWQKKPRRQLAGTWLVSGHQAGLGAYWGTADLQRTADGEYRARYALEDANGQTFGGESSAIVYTGYEWRGSGLLRGRATQEVFALSEDGQTLSGRWFTPGHVEEGGDWLATRAGDRARIIAVSPTAVRRGTTTRVTIFGEGLTGTLIIGADVNVVILSRTSNIIAADVTVNKPAKVGYAVLGVGKASAANLFGIYDRIDRLEVTPSFGIARLGGGKTDPVNAQYEAVGIVDLTGPNGAAQPIRLGNLPVKWSIEPYNKNAIDMNDVKFAGNIDQTGKFMPAGAGPNPKRKYSGNNTGDLSVVATSADQDGATLTGKAHLVVTVQRWNNPPIY